MSSSEIPGEFFLINHFQKKVIRQVYRKEALFQGPFLTSAPDLVLLGEHGNNLKGATNRTDVFDPKSQFTGMHTQDDAFFLFDRPAPGLDDLHILDVTKTALTLLESSSVDAIEGRPILPT